MGILNGEFDEDTAARISQLTESLNAANDAFSIDSQSAIDNYISGMDAVLTNYNGDMAAAIQTFSSTVTTSIKQTAKKNLKQIGMTHDEVDALIDQFSADSTANIANFVKESGVATADMEESLNGMIAKYDASQAGRNKALKTALTNASEGFKQAVKKEAAVRDKIIGDNLKLTGQVLANTNEGVSQILGVTPEENLERAQAAATDFATSYAESAGTAAGNQAQQAARQSGMTKGAAALMGATAASNATNQQFTQSAETGLNAYKGAQEAQVKALEEQYARQRELAQAEMDEARKSETQDVANADRIAQLESDNAKMQAQMAQQDDITKAQQKMAAAQAVANATREDASKVADLEKDRLEKELDKETANKTTTSKAITDANNEAAKGVQQEAKDKLDTTMSTKDSAKQTQENELNNILDARQNLAEREHTNVTDTAKVVSEEQKQADTQHQKGKLEELEAARQSDLNMIDTNMNLANQQAGISGNASNLAANAATNHQTQVNNLVNAGVGAVGNLADAAALKKENDDIKAEKAALNKKEAAAGTTPA